MCHFHLQQYRSYRFSTLLKPEANEGLAKKALELYYIHVAERAFAKGVFIHSVSLEAMESVHFEI